MHEVTRALWVEGGKGKAGKIRKDKMLPAVIEVTDLLPRWEDKLFFMSTVMEEAWKFSLWFTVLPRERERERIMVFFTIKFNQCLTYYNTMKTAL